MKLDIKSLFVGFALMAGLVFVVGFGPFDQVTHFRVTCDTDGEVVYSGRARDMVLKNPVGGTTVDIGNSTVTSGAGLELAGGESIGDIRISRGDQLTCITAAGTQEIQGLIFN